MERGKRRGISKAKQMPAAHPARQHQLLPGMAAPPAFRALHRRDLQAQIIDNGTRLAYQPQRDRQAVLRYQPVERARELARHALHPRHRLHQETAIDDDLGVAGALLGHPRTVLLVGNAAFYHHPCFYRAR
ncbi:hypothetical protein IP83_04955 [Novosphingobium sp. AAP93]|nr:hypothetical protein IP83_04955 [Novosphingobium sp. AAP93]